MVKQFQGEHLGSLLSAFFESMGGSVSSDGNDLMLDDAPDSGLADAVKDNDHLEAAPLLGQHNYELLAELGLSEHQIAALEAEGIIGRAPGAA